MEVEYKKSMMMDRIMKPIRNILTYVIQKIKSANIN